MLGTSSITKSIPNQIFNNAPLIGLAVGAGIIGVGAAYLYGKWVQAAKPSASVATLQTTQQADNKTFLGNDASFGVSMFALDTILK